MPTSGTLRITRQGNTFRGYYWQSDHWVQLGSVGLFMTPAVAAFEANNFYSYYPGSSQEPAFELHWDNFYAEAEAVVPEPAAMALLVLGGMALIRRRRL